MDSILTIIFKTINGRHKMKTFPQLQILLLQSRLLIKKSYIISYEKMSIMWSQ